MMLLIIFFIIFSLTLFYTNYLLTLHQTKYETIHLSNYTKYKEEIINFYKIKKHTNILVKLHINLDKTYNYDLLNTYILSQHKTEFENQQQKYTKKYFDIINNEHTLITLNTTDNKTLKFSLPKLNYIKWLIETNFLDITKIN